MKYKPKRQPHYTRRGRKTDKSPQVRIPIEKGKLTKFGYSIHKSDRARHTALNKAVKKYGPLSVFRKLNVQITLRKRSQPEARKVFEKDADWMKQKLG